MTYLQNKKRAFIAMIANLSTKIKRLVSGGTSVTLSDVADSQSLVLLQFQGNGSGDKTENLFDYSTSAGFTSQYSGLTNTWNGDVLTVKCTATSRGGNIDLGTFDAGTYYISGSMYANGTTSGLNIFVNGKNFQRRTPYIITLTDTSQVQLYQSFNNTIQNYTIKNIMIVKSSVPTDYQPYGYKIGVLSQDGSGSLSSIAMTTYIGTSQLASGEKVSVNFETETATRGTTDIKPLNQHLFDLEATTFEGTTVIVDGSTNKVASMDVEYYASK